MFSNKQTNNSEEATENFEIKDEIDKLRDRSFFNFDEDEINFNIVSATDNLAAIAIDDLLSEIPTANTKSFSSQPIQLPSYSGTNKITAPQETLKFSYQRVVN